MQTRTNEDNALMTSMGIATDVQVFDAERSADMIRLLRHSEARLTAYLAAAREELATQKAPADKKIADLERKIDRLHLGIFALAVLLLWAVCK